MPLERTLIILKPDAIQRNLCGEIICRFEKKGLQIVGMKMMKISPQLAETHYESHKGKPFYAGLVKFMTEGPIVVMALEREDAIKGLREVMGATNPANAAEGTIRKKFAENIERNCIHGSDAPETAEQELRFFFSTADLL